MLFDLNEGVTTISKKFEIERPTQKWRTKRFPQIVEMS